MAETRVKSTQFDWASLSNNIKVQKTTSTSNPASGSLNLGGNGGQVTLTVATDCYALVNVYVACTSTTDYEMKPIIYLDGAVHSMNDAAAALGGGASNRALQRTHFDKVSLTAGAHTIAVGIYTASATSPSIVAGAAAVSVIVLGEVTA